MGTLKYVVREKTISNLEFGLETTKKQVVIVQQYINDNGAVVEIPSCLNKFIMRWSKSSINNARNMAVTICAFLNYVKIQVNKREDNAFLELQTKGLYGLNNYHAANYLNYCITVNKIKYSTVKQYEKRLVAFYAFLSRNGILNKQKVNLYDGTQIKKTPFTTEAYMVYYPSKRNVKTTKLVNMDEYLWQLFLRTAQKIAPDIVFGIAIQMFGGLRKGEVVNLTIDDIKVPRVSDRSKLNITVQDNFLLLFKNRPEIDIGKCQVKRPRNQVVYNFNKQLYNYCENHLQFRNDLLKNKRKKTKALFVNDDGLAMSGAEYEQKWKKVKKEFLAILEQKSYQNYEDLTRYTWGTHIGRGIFTNLCIVYEFANDARELANLRGDLYTESSQAYIDEYEQRKKIDLALKNIDKKIGEKNV